jgi:hypothetical protein
MHDFGQIFAVWRGFCWGPAGLPEAAARKAAHRFDICRAPL